MQVKATREGLIGQTTASGWRIDAEYPFVALPSRNALNKWVKITNPANGISMRAQVRDVGPHNMHDDNYVFHGARPLAEQGIYTDEEGRQVHGTTNNAGIDLGQAVWLGLEMKDNTDVDWEFV